MIEMKQLIAKIFNAYNEGNKLFAKPSTLYYFNLYINLPKDRLDFSFCTYIERTIKYWKYIEEVQWSGAINLPDLTYSIGFKSLDLSPKD
jgi:hypothetical protein